MTITQPVDMTECRAAQFNAFSHPVRLRLLSLIAETGGKLTVEELTNRMQTTMVAYHLHRMSRAGILTGTRHGYFTYYAIRPEAISDMQNELDRLLWQHTQAAAEARRV